MAENQGKCTGNCMACTMFQRQYCASQLAYSNMRMLEQMQKVVTDMKEKIEAMQSNEATLFDPTSKETKEEPRPIAQPGAGATVVPQESLTH